MIVWVLLHHESFTDPEPTVLVEELAGSQVSEGLVGTD